MFWDNFNQNLYNKICNEKGVTPSVSNGLDANEGLEMFIKRTKAPICKMSFEFVNKYFKRSGGI